MFRSPSSITNQELFLKRCRSAAKKGGWTQKQLAEFIGVSYKELWAWQTGRKAPNIEPIQLFKLVAVLELSFEDIVKIFHPNETLDRMALRQQLSESSRNKRSTEK